MLPHPPHLTPVACRVSPLLILLLLSAARAASVTSMFLSADELDELMLQGPLVCGYETYRKGAVVKHQDQFHIAEVQQLLTDSHNKVFLPKDYDASAPVISVNAHYRISELVVEYRCSSAGLLQLQMDTPLDMLCFEVLAIQRKFDAVFSIWHTPCISLGRRHHNIPTLENHFGIPIISTSAENAITFTDKSTFASWMAQNGYGAFMPAQYETADEARFPCLVKKIDDNHGKGIYVVHNRAELDAAVAKLDSSQGEYLLQEALVGTAEPIIHFVAFRGKLLATACVIHRERLGLFITGQGAVSTMHGEAVDCREFDKISPLGDLTRRIVRDTEYNGFGCFNFKFAPNKITQDKLAEALEAIKKVPNSLPLSPTIADFGPGDAVDKWDSYVATPKLFDFNTRIGGSQHDFNQPETKAMFDLYIREFVAS